MCLRRLGDRCQIPVFFVTMGLMYKSFAALWRAIGIDLVERSGVVCGCLIGNGGARRPNHQVNWIRGYYSVVVHKKALMLTCRYEVSIT